MAPTRFHPQHWQYSTLRPSPLHRASASAHITKPPTSHSRRPRPRKRSTLQHLGVFPPTLRTKVLYHLLLYTALHPKPPHRTRSTSPCAALRSLLPLLDACTKPVQKAVVLRDVHAAVAWAIEEGWGALYAITVERTYLRHRVVAYDQMSGKESLEEVCARYWGILEQLAGLWETERFLPGRCFAAFREASKGMALKEKVRMEMSLGLDDVSEPLVPEWVVYGEDDVDEGGEVDEKGECDDVANGEARLN